MYPHGTGRDVACAVNGTSSALLIGESTVSWLFNDHLQQRNESPTFGRSYIEESSSWHVALLSVSESALRVPFPGERDGEG